MLTVPAAFIGRRHLHFLQNSVKIIAEPVA
jgi:hypothetical protein